MRLLLCKVQELHLPSTGISTAAATLGSCLAPLKVQQGGIFWLGQDAPRIRCFCAFSLHPQFGGLHCCHIGRWLIDCPSQSLYRLTLVHVIHASADKEATAELQRGGVHYRKTLQLILTHCTDSLWSRSKRCTQCKG